MARGRREDASYLGPGRAGRGARQREVLRVLASVAATAILALTVVPLVARPRGVGAGWAAPRSVADLLPIRLATPTIFGPWRTRRRGSSSSYQG